MSQDVLKLLQVEQSKLEKEFEKRVKEIVSLQKETTKVEYQLKEVKKQINELVNKKGIIVSEHALIRYFERKLGYNLQEIKDQIVTNKIKDQINYFKSGKFPNDDLGIKLVVRNNIIVTIKEI